MRTLYLFVNSQSSPRWLNCFSLTDDGHILGNHICSDVNYMIHDLHDRKDILEKIKKHFKGEEYEIKVFSYGQYGGDAGFSEAIKLANEKEQEYDKAGCTITHTKS